MARHYSWALPGEAGVTQLLYTAELILALTRILGHYILLLLCQSCLLADECHALQDSSVARSPEIVLGILWRTVTNYEMSVAFLMYYK